MGYITDNNIPLNLPLAQYLLHRLRQLSIYTIFGFPGEFNIPLLSHISEIPDLRWCGNTNELNASYASDGYSRMKRLSCLVTTFGAGEMSVINGIAGSYAEHVAILHVVGMPPISTQLKQLLLYHRLGNYDDDIFHRIASDISCFNIVLKDINLATEHIDKCISKAITEQRPVYCGIPMNLTNQLVNSFRLDTPLFFEKNSLDFDSINNLVDVILENLYKSDKPVIITDACISRHNCLNEIRKLLELTGFPVCVTPMSKGVVDEQMMNFIGVYMGSISSPLVREVVDFTDFVLVIGGLLTEFNTSSFHFHYKQKNSIILFDTYAKISNRVIPDISLKLVLKGILEKIDTTRINYQFDIKQESIEPRITLDLTIPLRQEWIWPRLSHWFQPGDIIITETGTSSFGLNQLKFPSNTTFVSQSLWGSVGYSIGACLGVLLALDELDISNRVILFVGDGALQLTVQEISTIIRWNLKPIIFVLNNKGYTIDRLLHGKLHANAKYNDIQSWNNLSLFSTFGCKHYDIRNVAMVGQFNELLKDREFATPNRIKMVDVILPSTDGPYMLMNTSNLIGSHGISSGSDHESEDDKLT